MNYVAILQELYSKTADKGIKLGLENMLQMMEALEHPDHTYKTIHVAGTNGKGSVCTKIAKALELDGFKVGLYTSPHISSFRERIQINSQMIPETSIIPLVEFLLTFAKKKNLSPTFFEITTSLALKYFANEKVDIAILETGLGGRLDATNVVIPLLSIITSISYDHMDMLGNSLEVITLEKAGIIKPHIPVLIGPRVDYSIISRVAKPLKSPIISIKGNFNLFDDENNQIAFKAMEFLKLSPSAITKGLEALPPCRLEMYQPVDLVKCKLNHLPQWIILDVAHNPDGLEHLFTAIKIKLNPRKIRVLCSLSSNKDIKTCLNTILKYTSSLVLTQAPNARVATIEELKSILEKHDLSISSIQYIPNPEESIEASAFEAYERDEILVICGTFFLMAPARKILGISVFEDPIKVGESFSKKNIA